MTSATDARKRIHMMTLCPRYIMEKVNEWKIVPFTVFLNLARYGNVSMVTKKDGIRRNTATGRHQPGGGVLLSPNRE